MSVIRNSLPGHSVVGHTLLLAAGCVAGLVIGELALRVGERAVHGPFLKASALLHDPRLGERLPSFAADCDARGYRNRVTLSRADIVAIGDSQTWGINARVAETWPARLQARTDLVAYNTSGGGFGMVQYASLLEEALTLRPRLVIVGLYLGNDLYDAYRAAYSLPAWEHLRLDAHENLVPDSIGPRADREWDEEKAFHQAYGRSSLATWGLWLRGHTAIGRLSERAGLWPGRDAWFEIGRAWAMANPNSGSYYEDDAVRTVFTIGYRALGVDGAEPRIREGIRLTTLLMAQAHRKCREQETAILILLIPTKERAFAGASQRQGSQTPAHARLARDEDVCRAMLMEAARPTRIPTLDLLGALAGAIELGQQVYPTNIESHPNPAGYDVIARAIADWLRAEAVIAEPNLSGAHLGNEDMSGKPSVWTPR